MSQVTAADSFLIAAACGLLNPATGLAWAI
jgi:hypothetical protein